MNSIRLSLFLFCCIALLSSCDDNFFNQTIDAPVDDYETQLAFNSFITNTDSVYLVTNVTRTYGFNDYIPLQQHTIDLAIVELFEDDKLMHTYQRSELRDGGGYSIPINKKFDGIGKTYRLKVSHPNFEIIEASQTMPKPVPLSSVEYKALSTTNNFFSEGEIKLVFNDPPDEENYYEIAIFAKKIHSYIDENGDLAEKAYYAEVRLMEDGILPDPLFTEGYNGNALLLDDKTFNGKQQVLRLPFEQYLDETDFKIYWRTVTKDYFLFSSSLQHNHASKENPFTEPVSLYSNVDGGVGCFGMRAELVYDIKE